MTVKSFTTLTRNRKPRPLKYAGGVSPESFRNGDYWPRKKRTKNGQTSLKKGEKLAKRLKTLEDCRRYLAKLVNKVETDEIEPAKAGKLGYLLNILIACIKDGDLEKRVADIEKILTDQKGEKS